MKRFIRVLGLFLVTIVTIALLIVGSCFVFKDQILAKAESKLSKKLGTEIKTTDLDLDPFTHFPYFTLVLEDLNIKGSNGQPFIKASYLEVLIDPLSALQEEVDISSLILNDGAVFLSKRDNKWNYEFSENTSSSGNSRPDAKQKDLQFSDLQFNDVALKVNDHDAQMSADITIEDFKGSLTLSDEILLQGKLNLIPQKIKTKHYLATAKEKWNVELNIRNEDERIKIDQLEIAFSENKINIEGSIEDEIDLKGEIEIQETESILSWVSEDYHSYIFSKAQYDFTIDGKSSDPNGKVKIQTEKLKLDLIKENEVLQLDGTIEAVFLNTFQDDYLFTDGKLMMSKLAIDKTNPSIETMTGTVSVKDLNLKYLDKEISVITDQIVLDNGTCTVDKLLVSLDNSDLEFNGTINKTNDTYSFNGALLSDKILASDFLSMMQDTSESTIKIKGDFKIEIDELINNNWKGEEILGKLKYADDILDYEVSLSSFDGKIESKGSFKNSDELHFISNSSFTKLKIEDILDQLQNLGQEMITSDNLSGSLSGNAMLDFCFREDLSINKTKSHALVAVKAEKGRLKDFKLLEDFSKYIDIKDLRSVRFAEMTNYFEWKGDYLVVPIMYIKNNAANFLVSGYQNTQNELLYYLQINASEILAKKFGKKKRRAKKKGWWNMYYLIEGDVEDFEVHSDKDQVKAGLNKSLIEKEEIFDKLVTVFGYTEVLQSIEDWEDL